MVDEQEAQSHCEHGMPSDMGCDDCIISKLVAEREADRAAMREALEAAKELNRYYVHIWDRVDGCAVIFPDSIPGFEGAVEAHAAAITKLQQALGEGS